MEEHEPTIKDVLVAVNDFATKTEERLERIETKMNDLPFEIDKKLLNLRGDLVVHM